MSATYNKRAPWGSVVHHKLTTRQASFARELHRNAGNASAAYRHAYDALDMSPKCLSSTASKLARRPAIKAYVADLERQAVTAAQVDKNMLVDRMMQIVDLAVEKGDLAVASRTLELVGKALPRSVWAGDRQDEKPQSYDELCKEVAKQHERLQRGIERSQDAAAKDKSKLH